MNKQKVDTITGYSSCNVTTQFSGTRLRLQYDIQCSTVCWSA